MKFSAPIYRLKRKAKRLSREGNIPHNALLDRIAADEGFGSWSLLAASVPSATPARQLFARLQPGDMLLVAARPGHGKTLLSLELAVEAMKAGRQSFFFSLEYTERDILDRFRAIGAEPSRFDGLFTFDNSDAICAAYIIDALKDAPRGTLVVVDYLQLLDQKRGNSELMVQVRELKTFARARGIVFVFISQVDRSYDPSRKPVPDIADIRLPNPLDLTLFDKACFINNGEVRFHTLN